MVDLRRIESLLSELKQDGYLVSIAQDWLDTFANCIEKCRFLSQNDQIYFTSIDYEKSEEAYNKLYGFLRGIEMYNFISSDRIHDCMDELVSAYDF